MTILDNVTFRGRVDMQAVLGDAPSPQGPRLMRAATALVWHSPDAAASIVQNYFDSHGWGFGVSMVTRRDDVVGSVGQFGWDGGLGTSWRSNPREDMVGILMTQRAWTSPTPPDVCLDFWTSAYQAIDD